MEEDNMKVIENQTFDIERALYGSNGILVRNCSFDGPADGESALRKGGILKQNIVFLICVIHSGMTTV